MVGKSTSFFQYLGKELSTQNCYLCHCKSICLVCSDCISDAEFGKLAVPGLDLLEIPTIAKHIDVDNIDACYAIGFYEQILSKLIKKLKFSKKIIAAKALSEFFNAFVLNRLNHTDELPELLIPVPLSFPRQIYRGFNQAEVLAELIARDADIPVRSIAKRSRHTKAQAKLNANERHSNIANAFSLTQSVESHHICIVDDVLTTGATINELARIIRIKRPDIKISVWAMAIARQKDE